MNKKEQLFATKLKNWLIAEKFTRNALIEVKVTETSRFNPKDLRPSQKAVINKFVAGIPFGYKISDSSVGSKLVDLIYINPLAIQTRIYVAIKFNKSKHCYLVPMRIIKDWTADDADTVPEAELKMFNINRYE